MSYLQHEYTLTKNCAGY